MWSQDQKLITSVAHTDYWTSACKCFILKLQQRPHTGDVSVLGAVGQRRWSLTLKSICKWVAKSAEWPHCQWGFWLKASSNKWRARAEGTVWVSVRKWRKLHSKDGRFTGTSPTRTRDQCPLCHMSLDKRLHLAHTSLTKSEWRVKAVKEKTCSTRE